MLELTHNDYKSFSALGEIFKDENTVQATLTGEYRNHSFGPVECRLVIPQPDVPLREYLHREEQRLFVQFRGRTSFGQDVWIPRLELKGGLGEHSEGTAELFVEGDLEDFECNEGQVVVYLTLPLDSISESLDMRYEYQDDGSMVVAEGQTRKTIEWTLTSGEKVGFTAGFAFVPAVFEADRSVVRRRYGAITITFDAANVNSLKEVVDKLWSVLDDDMWLLSFVSQKYINWYEGIIFLESSEQSCWAQFRRYDPFLMRKQQRVRVDPFPRGLLVDVETLTKGVFETMISNLRETPLKDTFLRVIQNLLITYEDNYIETDLGVIYTALEMLVYGLSEDKIRYLMDEEDFNELAHRIKRLARSVLKDEFRMSKSDRGDFYEKLSELNRRSYRKQLHEVLGQHVDVSKLFPPSMDADSGVDPLSGVISRRNDYIHQGKIDDIRVSNTDFHRIRLLIELTILKLLGYPLSEYNRLSNDLWYVRRASLSDDYSFEASGQE